jgi:heme/copper-type cytochrome/quinol oxidase subunit 2
MAWSITMLMHASANSANFDENTASTTLAVTLIAYQWGWSYYYPRDVIAQLSATPKRVGWAGVEADAGA